MTESSGIQDSYCQVREVLENLVMAKQEQSVQKFY